MSLNAYLDEAFGDELAAHRSWKRLTALLEAGATTAQPLQEFFAAHTIRRRRPQIN